MWEIDQKVSVSSFMHLRDLCAKRNGRETGWYEAKPTFSKVKK